MEWRVKVSRKPLWLKVINSVTRTKVTIQTMSKYQQNILSLCCKVSWHHHMGRESEAANVRVRSPTRLGPRGECIAVKRPDQKIITIIMHIQRKTWGALLIAHLYLERMRLQFYDYNYTILLQIKVDFFHSTVHSLIPVIFNSKMCLDVFYARHHIKDSQTGHE